MFKITELPSGSESTVHIFRDVTQCREWMKHITPQVEGDLDKFFEGTTGGFTDDDMVWWSRGGVYEEDHREDEPRV